MKYSSQQLRQWRLREPVDNGLIVFACLWPKTGENLGTLARTADALNASLVVPSDRPARQALKRGNTIGTHNTLVELVDDPQVWLLGQMVSGQTHRVVAVELAEGAIPLSDLAPATDRTIVLLGHESSGVPDWALAVSDEIVQIPMWGVGNSLNVAVAGSLVGYKLAGLT